MNKYLLTASAVCLLMTSPALAQHKPLFDHAHGSVAKPAPSANATATGTGVGIANSSSQSGAVAISGQGGKGGNSSLVINNPANTTSTVNTNVSGTTTSNINQKVSGETTSHLVTSGTTTVRNAPGIVAPGLSAAGLETCLGSASGGISVVGFGLTGGSSTPDPNCNARLDARTLWSIGLKKAAVARLCLSEPIYRSMPEVCAQYLPVVQPVGYGVAVEVAPPYGGYVMGAPIELIDGKTGRNRMCNKYNEAKQKCLAWADGKPVRMASRSPLPKQRKLPETPAALAAAPAPAPEPAN